ncbi:alpha/beta hydrolase [Ilumatobacter sp.]|uniref:alpha/beta hydrolase n=1 Tax=Ilumatobacter sp. TaxID=1967498 RepID=UPI003AF5F839
MTLTTYPMIRDGAERLLILLHGWSAEQHHLAAYVPLVDPDERFSAFCPRAPHDLPEGDGASWYDRTDGTPVAESYRGAVDAVDGYVRQKMERAGIGPEGTVIGGFSQGGFLALSVALRTGGLRCAGVWAMCCGLADVDGLDLDLTATSGAGRRALIQVGEHDPIITPDRGRAAAAALTDAGWDVSTHGYEMAHSQRIEMMIDARSWLASI